MAILTASSSSSGDRPDPVAPGQKRGVCIGVVDLGTQETMYGRKRRQEIVWEVPEDTMSIEENGQVVQKPKWISKRFTRSLHEKAALRQTVEMWRGAKLQEGEQFDLKQLLGINATLSISHKVSGKGNTYSVVDFVMPPQGESVQPVHEPFFFDFDDNTPLPDGVKGFTRDDIQQSPEWLARQHMQHSPPKPPPAEGQDDNGVPF